MSDYSYIHHLHAGAPGEPMLVVLHGTGGDENQFFDFGRRLMPMATILSPRGDVLEQGAARFFRRTGEGVYDMADLARATGKLASFVQDMAVDQGAGRIFGLGFSNGANILANILIEKGIFDAAVLMHPLIPFRPKSNPDLREKRILITAGEHDPISPRHVTQALADYFRAENADLQLEWHPGGHDIRPNEIEAVRRFFAR